MTGKRKAPLPLFLDEAKTAPGLSAQDVCAILKSCRQNQVVRLKFGDLELEFSPREGAFPIETNSGFVRRTPKLTDEIVEKGELEKRVGHEQESLDLLAVEDPVAYEKFLMGDDAERMPSTDDDD